MSADPDQSAAATPAGESAGPPTTGGKRDVWALTVSHAVMTKTLLFDSLVAAWVASIPLAWCFSSARGGMSMGFGCELAGLVPLAVLIGLAALVIWNELVRMIRRGPWKWRGGWPLLLAGIAHGVFCACGIVFLVVMPLSDYYDMTAARTVGVALIFLVPVTAPFRLRVRA